MVYGIWRPFSMECAVIVVAMARHGLILKQDGAAPHTKPLDAFLVSFYAIFDRF